MPAIKPVAFDPNCAACRQLWQHYADATTAHIRSSGKQETASLQHDDESEAAMERDIEAAYVARQVARTAIEEHEQQHRAADKTANTKPD